MEDRYLPLFEEAGTGETPPQKHKKKPGTAQVVLIQSICCAVLILLFWLFKVLGGGAYTQLETAFQNALQNNALLATVAQMFEEGEPDESYVLSGGTTAVSVGSTTDTSAATGTTATSGSTSAATTSGTTTGTTVSTAATTAATTGG